MFLDQVFECDILFLRDVVDGKIPGFASNPRSPLLEHGLEVCVFEKQGIEDECGSSHDSSDVFGPSPAQITFRDERSDNGRNERLDDHDSRDDRDSYASRLISEEV